MSKNGSAKKDALLGQPHGTATAKLRKALLFKYVRLAGHDSCARCGRLIDSIDDFSIEHKTPWMSAQDPVKAFFDLDDVAFSHLRCNVGAAEIWNKKYVSDDERWQGHLRNARASKKRRYCPDKRRQAYLDGRW